LKVVSDTKFEFDLEKNLKTFREGRLFYLNIYHFY